MIKSLKSIVITLGIIIMILSFIIIITLYKRFNVKQNNSDFLKNTSSLSIEASYDIVSINVEDNLIYIYLRDKKGKDLIRIYDLKSNKILREINLR